MPQVWWETVGSPCPPAKILYDSNPEVGQTHCGSELSIKQSGVCHRDQVRAGYPDKFALPTTGCLFGIPFPTDQIKQENPFPVLPHPAAVMQAPALCPLCPRCRQWALSLLRRPLVTPRTAHMPLVTAWPQTEAVGFGDLLGRL